jgi:hypothetical protein
MIDLIDFKVRSNSKKNYEIIGSILVVYYPKINEILAAIASENTVWVDRNTEWMGERLMFLPTTHYYYKKIFMIIPSFQKQTP